MHDADDIRRSSAVDDGGAWEALYAREPIFHRPEFGTSTADFAAMITDDYWEIGASGRVYSRAFVLEVLDRRYRAGPVDEDLLVEGFACRRLTPELYQAAYTLWQGERCTRRSTLWTSAGGTWRALFHQGTVVEDAVAPD